MADNSRLLWILVSSAFAIISIISSLQEQTVISGFTAVLAASFAIYSMRLGRSGTAKNRMMERTGYLLIESALLASIVLNLVVPRWLSVLAVLAFTWSEILPEVYRKIFSSKIWLTMGRDVRMVLLGLGVIAGSFNELLFFYMTVIYAGVCLVDVIEVAVKARNS